MTRLRIARWVVLALALSIVGWLVYRVYEHQAELGGDQSVNQLLLAALSFVMVVLALALAGVVIRNLVRLIIERKRGILGSRLRTKLVFFFLALVLLPSTVLFMGSAQVIKQTVEAILRTPLEDLTRQSSEFFEEWSDYIRTQSARRATGVAEEIRARGLLAPQRASELDAALQRWLRLDPTQRIRVVRNGRTVAEVGRLRESVEPARRAEFDELTASVVETAQGTGEEQVSVDHLGEALLVQAAVPVERGRAQHVVSIAVLLPTRLAGNLEQIARADRAYRQFRANRRDMVRLYVTLIAVIFLVTIFVATWLGFYVSRRITVSLQDLAAATREISSGNLGVRVRTEVGDEMGMLVESFNEMAAELQENREVITRSTAELRRSNRALDERRRYIETLLANLSTAVISLDADGRVTTANPAVEKILGVELNVGDNARVVFEQNGLQPLSETLVHDRSMRRDGLRRDVSLSRQSGALKLSMHVSPLYGGTDDPPGTLIMVEDLTELLRAQKASAWREVARRIAHEIKNPLTPIQLAAQRLRKKFSEGAEMGSVIPSATESIEREVGALKRLVDEFSRFARMPEVAPRQVAFGEVLDSVLELYKGLPGIDWQLDVDPRIGEVRLDPEQFRRVLINLIDNAVAAMSGSGVLRISAHLADAAGRIRIEVADDGPGIDPTDRDKMFSPYFSTKKRGTGLGLAIVHRVITDHAGTIQVEDNSPRGARFVIEIPAAGP